MADGANASFATSATGDAPLTYQWRRNGTDLVDGAGVAGAASAALTLAAPYAFNASQISVRVANGAGNVVSSSALLTVTPIAPAITTQPTNASAIVGAAATFSAVISGGTAPVTYQWKRNGTAIAGATNASYSIPVTAVTDDNASLALDIINPSGTLSSTAATLRVYLAPSITTQPANLSVTVGAPATVSVGISSGTAPVEYQWKRNGTAIVGATSSSFTLPATEIGDNGAMFAVDILSLAGTLSSAPAILTVTPAGPGFNLNVNTVEDLIDEDRDDGVCRTSVNTCSLRAAIMQGNHIPVSLLRINVPAGIYLLTRPPTGSDEESSGNLNLPVFGVGPLATVIAGAGAGSTVIDANQIDNAFEIATGRVATLSGLTLRNGKPPPTRSGGAIFNSGNLTVSECVIEGSQANDAGGGISSSGTLKVIRSTIRSNTAFYGGGLFLTGPTTVRDSTIHANHADFGGGIFNDFSVDVVNSTLSQNTANTDGGGIDNYGGLITPMPTAGARLYNTTVTDNDADHDRDEKGGIGGGIINKAGSTFAVANSLIARNTLADSPIYDDCQGTVQLNGGNLFGETSGCAFGIFKPGLIPISGPGSGMDTALRDNGGPTLTVALLPDSVAIDFTLGNNRCIDEENELLTTDQRGAPRIAGAGCDVGAYEFDAIVP